MTSIALEKMIILAASNWGLLEEALSMSAFQPFVVFGTLDLLAPAEVTQVSGKQACKSPVKVYFYEHG
ncbi:hypothetical protein [Desulfovirgula thermocuniculi]|uniref:hypothetical protein n=1 Tax=Desulfovirgula thermocuniculi TaxID=348842 RepID=UPI00040D3D03|nr:hypothetical protein [Desulfovirgula thermocuniculi]